MQTFKTQIFLDANLNEVNINEAVVINTSRTVWGTGTTLDNKSGDNDNSIIITQSPSAPTPPQYVRINGLLYGFIGYTSKKHFEVTARLNVDHDWLFVYQIVFGAGRPRPKKKIINNAG